MAFATPTPADIKQRFPEFASKDDGFVQLLIDEALGEVGETWLEKDRALAVMYLVAHLLAMSAQAADGGALTGNLKSRKVGDVQVEFHGLGNPGTGALATFRMSVYGQKYLSLMRRSFPAVVGV